MTVESVLVAADPAFGEIVEAAGPFRLSRPRLTHFAALTRAVCFQQLAGAAATTIHSRLVATLDGEVTPESALAAGEARLRSAGLSGAKAASVLDLADATASGRVRLGSIGRRGDDAVVDELTQVRGIGRWTAEMFLMFQLRRPDVWPVGDLGVRNGWALLHGSVDRPTPAELEVAGAPLSGVRSAAAWYCWRAADTVVPV
jgi:3-methyladenine DNA glycosylase/8-oxoguanine DNA glycosylase